MSITLINLPHFLCRMKLAFILLIATVSSELDINLPADLLSDLVERSEDNELAYSLAEGEEEEEPYKYVINYEGTIDDFSGINASYGKCGKEIEQLDVSKMKAPHQIRLSYTGKATEMAITWTTNDTTEHEQVNYGLMMTELNYTSTSISHQYKWRFNETSKEWYYTSGFIHEALMINLIPGRIHYYQIESNGMKSEIIKFVAAPEEGSDIPVSFLHVGDVGTFGTSVMVTNDMMKRMEVKQFHGMIHCGDISYANKYDGERPMDAKNKTFAEQKVWDTWGQMVEPVGSKMAYMAVPGNHELDIWDSTNENGTIYAKRFIMPGNERYFSFAVGMVHFVAVSTDESIDAESTQGQWFKNILTEVNENRDKWPWLVVFQHRPIYNSNKNHGNWTGKNNYSTPFNPVHKGWPDNFEELIVENNVNFVLAGHVHHYERSWPVRNREDVLLSYDNVDRPVHITCGHAGKGLYQRMWDFADRNTYDDKAPRFSAARDNENWGHCELDFIDTKTAKHRMYLMGNDTPTEEVTITRSGARRLTLSVILLVVGFVTSLLTDR
ncbi:hypothetical protein ACHWQZ_G006140 [Mnemiopsis leidyi]